MIERKTLFSDCRRYRFVLWREWGVGALPLLSHRQPANHFVQFIGLNPSKANESDNDMTITKCVGFAKRWGYGAVCMTNLFTFVSTDPARLRNLSDADRDTSLKWVETVAAEAGLIVAAWGNDGADFVQSQKVVNRLREMGKPVWCLGKTVYRVPRHPSRIAYDTQLEKFNP